MATNLRISGHHSTVRSTSDIRINYWDPRKIIAASNAGGSGNQAQFYSSDGGATWGQTALPFAEGDNWHDGPAVDWTSDGKAWAMTAGSNDGDIGRQRLYRSLDGGATWTFDSTPSGTQQGAGEGFFQMMRVDHSSSSPHRDNLYAAWIGSEDTTGNDLAPYVSWRAGAGGSWHGPLKIGSAQVLFTLSSIDITTNSAGDVFAFWSATNNSSTLFVAKSIDGGRSFAAPVTVASTIALGGFIFFPAAGLIGPDGAGTDTGYIYVSGGAFRDSANDIVYAVWQDLNEAALCGGNLVEGPAVDVTSPCKVRIWFSRSTDGGGNWESRHMINDQPKLNDQFNPRLTVDDTTGDVMIIYYDTINDPGRVKADVWMQHSSDHGANWSRGEQISTSATNETEGGEDVNGRYGFYNGLTGHAGSFFPSWTDRRNGAREEIWTARLGPNQGFGPQSGTVGDFDGDGIDEVLVSSAWGIGILKKSGGKFTSIMTAANGTRLPGGWKIVTTDDSFGPVSDFDNDGRDEILVRSSWGIGVLKYRHGGLTAVGMVASGTQFATGTLHSLEDVFLPLDSGKMNQGVLYRNSMGITFINLMSDGTWDTEGIFYPWGTSIGDWTVGIEDKFGPVADFDGDALCEVFVTSSWGVGFIDLSGHTRLRAANGTALLGGWKIDTTDTSFSLAEIYEYNPPSHALLLATSRGGIATLMLLAASPAATLGSPGTPASLIASWTARDGSDLGGWTLNTFTNRFGPTASYINPGPPPPADVGQIGPSGILPQTQVLVQSPWGIAILGPSYAGATDLTVIAKAKNGSNIGSWTVDGSDNFVAVGKFSGGTQDELLVTSNWGIGLLKLPGSFSPANSTANTTRLSCPLLQPNGVRLGEWILETNDDTF